MYPETPTVTEEMIDIIKNNAPRTTSIIQQYINHHMYDAEKMMEGVNYYFNQSDITNRQIYTYEGDQKVIDEDATNNKLPTGWHKTLVDQKVAYLVGKPAQINSKKEDDTTLELIQDILGDDFDDVLPELVKQSSNKGKEWLHVYIDEEGAFDYIIIPAQEFVPIYENTKRKQLIGGIRFYDLDDGTRKIELWDDQQVTYYEQMHSSGEIVIDVNYEVNPQPHFYYNETGYPWEAVPFIEFKNNEEAVSDLTFYKELIDAYELVLSDTENTLEDIQSFVYVLKGYEGTDLNQFKTDLKRYKVISVSDEQGSGVDTVKADIPVEAVESQLERLTNMIYQSGQGVDGSLDKLGNNPSGVTLKFLYSFLDMKAAVLERKFSKSLKTLMWFVCEYLSIAENTQLDYKNYYFTFDKSMIANEKEQIESANQSKGVISDESMLEAHPLVDDAQTELERLRRQREEATNAYADVDLDNMNDDEGSKEVNSNEGGGDNEGNQ